MATIPLLGFTFLLGFFYDSSVEVVGYIFVVLNGILVIFHEFKVSFYDLLNANEMNFKTILFLAKLAKLPGS